MPIFAGQPWALWVTMAGENKKAVLEISDNLRLNLKGFGAVSSYQIATKLHTDVPIALTTKPVDKNRDK